MAGLAENILREIQETVSVRRTDAVSMHIEMLESFENNTLSVDDIGTKVKDAAEAEAAAIVTRDQAAAAQAAVDKEDAIANRGVLEKIYGSLSSGFTKLGSSIKSDFSMLTAPLQLMAQAPGMKTIITLLKIVGMWLAKLFLHLITKKLFSGLREIDDAGSLDVKKTLGAFGAWAKGLVGIGPKKDRLTSEDREAKDKAKAHKKLAKGEQQELDLGPPPTSPPKEKGRETKAEITPKTAQESGIIGKEEQQGFDFSSPPKEKGRETKAEITPKTAQESGIIGKEKKKDPARDLGDIEAEEKTFTGEVRGFYKSMSEGWVNMKEKMTLKFEGIQNKVKGFYEGMNEGWDNIKKNLGPKFKNMKNKVDSFHAGMNKGWDNIKKNTAKKFGSMRKGVTGKIASMGRNLRSMASGILKSVRGAPRKALKLFRLASRAVAGSFLAMGKAMLKHVKRMAPIIIAFIVASLLFLGSMIMSIAALIAPAIPYILIGIAIALLVAGLIWLGMKIAENWDRIKEKFSMAMEQLSIWVAVSAHWLSGMFAPIEDKVKYFFAMLMDGLAGMVNAAIRWINKAADWIPGVGPNLIKGRMSEGNVDAAVDAAEVRAAERGATGVEIAERQAALDDRKAAYDAAGAEPSGDNNQQNVVVNQSTTKRSVSQNTQPTDVYGSQLALAQ
jgi:hypothetical protein